MHKATYKQISVVEERLPSLTLVQLLRRSDLKVSVDRQDRGLSYIVDIMKRKKPTSKQFGVIAHGCVADVSLEVANEKVGRIVQVIHAQRRFFIPVCLFYFSMRRDVGYYTWLAEPLVGEEMGPRLRLLRQAECKLLNRQAVDSIVTNVEQYYDALLIDPAV